MKSLPFLSTLALGFGALCFGAPMSHAQTAAPFALTSAAATDTAKFTPIVLDAPDARSKWLADTQIAQNAAGRRLPRYGVNVSAFFPTSSKTRRTFGSTWTSIGLGLGTSLVSRARIYPDFNVLSQKKDDNRAFALTVGARYVTPLGVAVDRDNPPAFAPYAGVGANVIYADIDAPSNGTDDKGFGVGANVALGSTLGRTFFVEGRYSVFSRTADFNLSGAQLVVGARF